jgi:RsiW-degrading membrane proteinase PrsW (M82 family)
VGIETLTFATLAPSLLLLAYFRSRDAYPEPARVVWTTFVLGVLTAIPVLIVAMPLSGLVSASAAPLLRGAYEAFVLAAIPEELFKLCVLLFYVRRHSAFDEPMDGLVYGVAASLGFATIENILYVMSGGMEVALMRAITAVPAHATMGAIMGYYVGQAHFTPARTKTLLWRAWWVPMVIHGLYNTPLLTVNAARESAQEGALTLFLLLLVPTVLIFAVVWAVRLARGLRALQLAGELTGEPLAPAIAADLAPLVTPPGRPASPLWWLIVLVGGLLVTAGALFIIAAAITAYAGGAMPTELVVATILFGVAPAALGVLLFRLGIGRLNQHDRLRARAG